VREGLNLKKISGLAQFFLWPSLLWFLLYYMKYHAPDFFMDSKYQLTGTIFIWVWWPIALMIIFVSLANKPEDPKQ